MTGVLHVFSHSIEFNSTVSLSLTHRGARTPYSIGIIIICILQSIRKVKLKDRLGHLSKITIVPCQKLDLNGILD